MNEKPKVIVRGELHFFLSDDNTVECWLGEPRDMESEQVFVVHRAFAADIIAGLKELINKP